MSANLLFAIGIVAGVAGHRLYQAVVSSYELYQARRANERSGVLQVIAAERALRVAATLNPCSKADITSESIVIPLRCTYPYGHVGECFIMPQTGDLSIPASCAPGLSILPLLPYPPPRPGHAIPPFEPIASHPGLYGYPL